MQPLVLQLVGTQAQSGEPLAHMQVALLPQVVEPEVQIMLQKPSVLWPPMVLQISPLPLGQAVDGEQYFPTPSSLPARPGWQHEPLPPSRTAGAVQIALVQR